MLIGTYIFAWTIYIRLSIFLNPYRNSDNKRVSVEVNEEDDHFQDQNRTEFEKNRTDLQKLFRPKFWKM